jgi:hypothetical protein
MSDKDPNVTDFYDPDREEDAYLEQIDSEERIQHKKITFWFIVIMFKIASGIATWHYFGDWIKKIL